MLLCSANLKISPEVILTCKNVNTGTVRPPLMMTVVIVMTQVVVKNSWRTSVTVRGPSINDVTIFQEGWRGGALCVEMDFTQTFQASSECNNIDIIWSCFYRFWCLFQRDWLKTTKTWYRWLQILFLLLHLEKAWNIHMKSISTQSLDGGGGPHLWSPPLRQML